MDDLSPTQTLWGLVNTHTIARCIHGYLPKPASPMPSAISRAPSPNWLQRLP